MLAFSLRYIQTISLFFDSLNAATAKSFCGTNLSFGRTFAMPMRICASNFGGTMSSAIYIECGVKQRLQKIKPQLLTCICCRKIYFTHRCNKNGTIPGIRLFKMHLQSNCSTHRLSKEEAWNRTEFWLFCHETNQNFGKTKQLNLNPKLHFHQLFCNVTKSQRLNTDSRFSTIFK